MTTMNIVNEPLIDRGTMSTVTVNKSALIEALVRNREEHRANFERALRGYHERSIQLLQQHIDRIREGKVERVYVSLPIPEDHTDDYDRVIAQMEWSIHEEIELSNRDFDQYVLDNWLWKNEFVTTTSMYTSE